jgi:hypothetical protein
MTKEKGMLLLAIEATAAALIFAGMTAWCLRDLHRARRDERQDFDDEYETLCRTLAREG